MPPDFLANKSRRADEGEPIDRGWHVVAKAAARKLTERGSVAPPEPAIDEEEGAEAEIAFLFRQRLAGLRRLPKRERFHALRAAKLWWSLALKALREKRAAAREFRHVQRRLARMPEPA